jgi:hypothetical protein
MHASFVDRMLAQVDGEVAPIWISQFIVTTAPPTRAALQSALDQLVAECERLRLCWDPDRVDWRVATPRPTPVAVRTAMTADLAIATLIASRIDLTTEPPLRVTIIPLADHHSATMIAIQLHHAIGDGRSLMFVNHRLWQLLAGPGGEPLAAATWSDRTAMAAAGRRWLALPAIARSRNRILARRGSALARSGDAVGAPMLASVRVPLSDGSPPPAELFFAGLVAGIRHHGVVDPAAPIRFRVPVDLRRELGLPRAIENPCSALPIEIPAAALSSTDSDRAIARRGLHQLSDRMRAGGHWATLVECVAIARVATAQQLRRHTRPELLAPRRGSTMVTTYVGTIDRYLTACPFPIVSLRTHTPTWGANAMVMAGDLVVNVSGFSGVWRRDELDAFVAAMMRSWIADDLTPELL